MRSCAGDRLRVGVTDALRVVGGGDDYSLADLGAPTDPRGELVGREDRGLVGYPVALLPQRADNHLPLVLVSRSRQVADVLQ